MDSNKHVHNCIQEREEVWIDPPSGWMYGFPKRMPLSEKDPVEWIISQGYPRSMVDSFKDHFHCRMWKVDKNKKT